VRIELELWNYRFLLAYRVLLSIKQDGRVASATMSASTTSLIATYSSGFTVDESVKATAPVRIGSQYGVLLGGSLGTLKVVRTRFDIQ
jgi:hypothetical protein